jgi:hypothetical protein
MNRGRQELADEMHKLVLALREHWSDEDIAEVMIAEGLSLTITTEGRTPAEDLLNGLKLYLMETPPHGH